MSDRPVDVQALQRLLAQASGGRMDAAFLKAVSAAGEKAWLPDTNTLLGAQGTGVLPKAPTSHPYAAASVDDALQYGAVSVMLHTGDGWSYFSRALSAMASGNLEIAQHLLYYAELRAAHAVMQRHGIFLFNGNNFVVDAQGVSHSLNRALDNPATHRATWTVFENWVQLSAPDFLSSKLRYLGKTLDEWKDAAPQPATIDAVIASLVRGWGLDLGTFAGDRNLRNRLSYDPTRLRVSPLGHSPASISQCLQDAWLVLEPGVANAFETFDGHLIREILGQHFVSRNHRRGLDSTAFRKEVDTILGDLFGEANPGIAESFCEPTKPKLAFLSQASSDPTDDRVLLHNRLIGMIGRALVLLRMATGATEDLCAASQVDAALVEPWAVDMLVNRGVALPEGSPRVFTDLWDEVLMQLEDLGDLHAEDQAEDMPVLWPRAVAVNSLTAFERVPAWAVA